MDFTILPRRAALPDSSQGSNTQRAFAPREQLPVPGQPHAEPQRPAHTPGIIPIHDIPLPEDTQQDNANVSPLDNIEQLKQKDIDYQIINRVLEKNARTDDDVEDTSHPESARTDIEHESRTATHAAQTEDIVHITEQSQLRIEQRRVTETAPEPQQSDPLALDLNGNGLTTTGLGNSIRFDINADGQVDNTSFITGGDAFVALDKNANGTIDSGSELFGDQTGAANGYLALATYDDNLDGQIDASDAIYEQLLLVKNTQGQLHTSYLKDEGIKSLSLSYVESAIAINTYDYIAQISSFERDDGSSGTSGDLLLGYYT